MHVEAIPSGVVFLITSQSQEKCFADFGIGVDPKANTQSLPLRPLPRRALVEGGHRRLPAQRIGWNLGARTYACRTALEGSPVRPQFFSGRSWGP